MAQTQSIFGASEALPKVSTIDTAVVEKGVPATGFVIDTSNFYESQRINLQKEVNEIKRQDLGIQRERLQLDRDKFAQDIVEYEEGLRTTAVKEMSDFVASLDSEVELYEHLSEPMRERRAALRERASNLITGYQGREQFDKEASAFMTANLKDKQYVKDTAVVSGVKQIMDDYKADDSLYDDVLVYNFLQKVEQDEDLPMSAFNPNNFKIVDTSKELNQLGAQYKPTQRTDFETEDGFTFTGTWDELASRDTRAKGIYDQIVGNPLWYKNYQNRAEKHNSLQATLLQTMPDKVNFVTPEDLIRKDAIAEARRGDIDSSAANNVIQRRRSNITNVREEKKTYTSFKDTPWSELSKEDKPLKMAWESLLNEYGIELANDLDYSNYAYNKDYITKRAVEVINEETGEQVLNVIITEPDSRGVNHDRPMSFKLKTRANIPKQASQPMGNITKLEGEETFNQVAWSESGGNPANIKIENDGTISGGFTHMNGKILTEFLSKFKGFDKTKHDATKSANARNIISFLQGVSKDRASYKEVEMDFFYENFGAKAEDVFRKSMGIQAPEFIRHYLYSSMGNNYGNMSKDNNIFQQTANALGGVNIYEDPTTFVRTVNRFRKAYVSGLPDDIKIDKTTRQSYVPSWHSRYDREANHALYLAKESLKGIDILSAMEGNGLTEMKIFMDGDDPMVSFVDNEGDKQVMTVGDASKYKNFPGFEDLPRSVQNKKPINTENMESQQGEYNSMGDYQGDVNGVTTGQEEPKSQVEQAREQVKKETADAAVTKEEQRKTETISYANSTSENVSKEREVRDYVLENGPENVDASLSYDPDSKTAYINYIDEEGKFVSVPIVGKVAKYMWVPEYDRLRAAMKDGLSYNLENTGETNKGILDKRAKEKAAAAKKEQKSSNPQRKTRTRKTNADIKNQLGI